VSPQHLKAVLTVMSNYRNKKAQVSITVEFIHV